MWPTSQSRQSVPIPASISRTQSPVAVRRERQSPINCHSSKSGQRHLIANLVSNYVVAGPCATVESGKKKKGPPGSSIGCRVVLGGLAQLTSPACDGSYVAQAKLSFRCSTSSAFQMLVPVPSFPSVAVRWSNESAVSGKYPRRVPREASR